MADGFETIGWILSVEDKATKQVEKITKLADDKFARMGHSISDVSDAIAAWGSTSKNPFKKAASFLGGSVFNVLSSGMAETAEATVSGFTSMSEAAVHFASKSAVGVVESMKTFGERVRGVGEILTNEYTFSDIAATMKSMFKGPAEDAAELNTEVAEARFGIRGAAVESESLTKSFFSIQSVMKGVNNLGGIGGVLLGPLAPLLKLFRPLLNMIVRQITPAMETFSAIIETAFAPLGQTLEIIARTMATKLVPLLAPFVSMLELVAVQIGTHIVKALDGANGVAGPLMEMFNGFLPVIMNLVGAFTKLAAKLLPVALKLFSTLAPIAVKLVTMLAETMVPIVEMWGEMVGELGPPLVKMVGDLLMAFLPIIKPLLEIWMIMYTKVFGPLLMANIKIVLGLLGAVLPIVSALFEWLGPWLEKTAYIVEWFGEVFSESIGGVVKFIEDFVTAVFVGFSPSLKDVFEFIPNAITFVVDAMESLAAIFERVVVVIVDNFVKPVIEGFTHIATRVLDWTETMFNLLWNAKDDVVEFVLNIDRVFLRFLNETIPRIWTGFWKWAVKTFNAAKDWFLGLVDKIKVGLGLDATGQRVRGLFTSVLTALRVPMEKLIRWVNVMLVDTVNDILKAEIPVVGLSLGSITQRVFGYSSIPPLKLAEGGVVGQQPGGMLAQIGEGANDELVLPLESRTVERVLAPLLPELDFPALDQLVQHASQIERLLRTGTLRVMTMNSQGVGAMRDDGGDNLRDAVGLEGMGF